MASLAPIDAPIVDHVRVTRALLSVSDKRDLVPFAKALAARGVELVSTGGTAAALLAAGLKVRSIDDLTGFPEMLDGRVKTLHPRVHGGLLGVRTNPTHAASMTEHGIEPIDLVCVNLYPFEATVRKPGCTDREAIENIDIGGPSMLRSAAKNHGFVAVVTDPSQYDAVANELAAYDGCTTLELRRSLAREAFRATASYDTAISAWFGRTQETDFPLVLEGRWVRCEELRYGENPHQRAAVYRDPDPREASVVGAPLLHGKPLSYNNLLDAAAALELVRDLYDIDPTAHACAVIKHTNPCGAAIAGSAREAFDRAYGGDPLAAFGGIVAFSRGVDAATARLMAEGERFLEVVVAESFDDEAVRILGERWKNVRLLPVGATRHALAGAMALRSVPGGLLVQERDAKPIDPRAFTHAAGPAPDARMLAGAGFAFTVAKHLKSNAVCITDGTTLLGAGAGQMDRVASCRLAVEKAAARLRNATLPIAASDAFFPFADGPTLLADAGVRCIVHPGGSKRDQDTLDLCAARGITCLLTGDRHFRH